MSAVVGPGIDPALEAPQATGEGASDAVTFSFADVGADCFGVARVGLSRGADGAWQASGLGVLFSGREPIAVRAAGGIDVAATGWDAARAAGVASDVVAPGAVWSVSFDSEDGRSGFRATFTAVSAAGVVGAEHPVARTGGMQGYEHLCRVTGTARVRGGERRLACLGQRGHSWGRPDWDRVASVRTVAAWFAEDHGVSLVAVRPAKAGDHGAEEVAATLWGAGEEDDELTGPPASGSASAEHPAAAFAVLEPRLSATYDAQGRQRRASFELFEHEDAFPRRGAGDVLCGTSLDLGRLQLDCAFFAWEMEGRSGVGRFDVLRRA